MSRDEFERRPFPGERFGEFAFRAFVLFGVAWFLVAVASGWKDPDFDRVLLLAVFLRVCGINGRRR